MAYSYKLLEVKNLNTSFRIDAGKVLSVNGVSFSLEKGKVLGIVGESGSGKSVTAYSIMVILDKNGSVDSGKIIYNGTDLLKVSEKEMRRIRGNRISIIFQDAMSSLNPTWTIGNQLREAILTHAKNPVQEAIYDLENSIKSDEQRIASMKKGLANHPERDYLRKDLAEIEKKLIEDKKLLEVEKEKAIASFRALKASKRKEIADARPGFNKRIREALSEHLKKYFALNPAPKKEEALQQKKALQLEHELEMKQAAYDAQISRIASIQDEYASIASPTAEQREIHAATLKGEKQVTSAVKHDLRVAKRKLRRYVSSYTRSVVVAPRKARRDAVIAILREKRNYRLECISAYKETKYSATKKALAMMTEVGITDPERRLKQYPFELSGGMLQRAMIAMALVENPDILIADEPTTALDVTIQAQILDLLKKLQEKRGMAIIIITHDLGVVAQMCDEVDIMYAGRIVERGTVEEIFYNPQHEYTKGLLNSMPKLDSDGSKLQPIKGNPVDLFCLPKGCAFSSRCGSCMEICLEKYPEEVVAEPSGHSVSCWKVVKMLHELGKIDVVNGTPTGKPLNYNGALIANERRKGKHAKKD